MMPKRVKNTLVVVLIISLITFFPLFYLSAADGEHSSKDSVAESQNSQPIPAEAQPSSDSVQSKKDQTGQPNEANKVESSQPSKNEAKAENPVKEEPSSNSTEKASQEEKIESPEAITAGRFKDFSEISLESLLEQEIETASACKQTVAEAPAISTVISSKWLNNLGIRNLNEAMSFVPGVVVADTYWRGPIITFRGVRMSLYNDKVLMLLDGIPMYEAVNSSYFIESIPVDAVSKIEIIRGPGSALYGSGAFSGVINIITKKPSEYNAIGGALYAGSFKTMGGNLYGGRQFSNGLGFSLAMSYTNDDGYNHDATDENGITKRLNFENDVFNSVLSFNFEDYVRIQVGYFDQRQNKFGMIPVHGYGGTAVHRQAFASMKLGYKSEFGLYTGAWIRYNYMDRKNDVGLFASSNDYPAPNYSLYKGQVVEGNLWIGFNKPWMFPWLSKFDFRWGAEYNLRMVENVYTLYDDSSLEHEIPGFEGSTEYPPPNVNEYAFFMQFSASVLNYVGLLVAGRANYLDTSKSWHLTPRAGVVVTAIPDTSIKLLYGRSYRGASVFESYVNVGNVLFGKTPLDPETMDSFEGSVSYLVKPANLSLSLNGYYLIVKNLIGRRPLTSAELAETNVPWSGSSAGSMVYDNIGNSHYYGGELEITGSPTNWISFFFNMAYVDGKEETKELDSTTGKFVWSDENDIPFIAHLTANAGISTTLSGRFIATLAAQYVGSREGKLLDSSTNEPTIPFDVDAYTLIKLNLRVKMPYNMEASLTLNNLLNESYSYPETVRRNIGEIPGGPGLSAFFSIGGEWPF